MAFKIPEAPNIIGSGSVARQPQVVENTVFSPEFKAVDTSDSENGIKAAGKELASYMMQQTQAAYQAACNQFNHDMIANEEKLKSENKKLKANDLYAKQEAFAKKLLEDMFSAPKDDDRIRIGDKALQQQFSDWANKQMPAYQTRMMNYTARELEQANQDIIKDGLNDANTFVMGSSYASLDTELPTAKGMFDQLAAMTAMGMDEEYIRGESIRLMDASLSNKIQSLADVNPANAAAWLYEENVQKYITSSSHAACLSKIQDNYVSYVAARKAEDMRNNGSSADGLDSKEMLSKIFPGKTEAELQTIKAQIYKEATDKHNAYQQGVQGMREAEGDKVANQIVAAGYDIQQYEQAIIAKQESDPKMAEVMSNNFQKLLSVRNTASNIVNDPIANDIVSEEAQKEINDRAAAMMEQAKESDEGDGTNRKMTLQEARKIATYEYISDTWDKSPEKVDYISNMVTEMNDSMYYYTKDMQEWTLPGGAKHRLYEKLYNDASTGKWHGEYVEGMDNIPTILLNNLSHAQASFAQIQKVKNDIPNIEDLLKDTVVKYSMQDSHYKSRLQYMVAQKLYNWKQHNGNYPNTNQLKMLVEEVSIQARDPLITEIDGKMTAAGIEYAEAATLDAKGIYDIFSKPNTYSSISSLSYEDMSNKYYRDITLVNESKSADTAETDFVTHASNFVDKLVEVTDEEKIGRRITDEEKDMFTRIIILTGDVRPIYNYIRGMADSFYMTK